MKKFKLVIEFFGEDREIAEGVLDDTLSDISVTDGIERETVQGEITEIED